MSEVVKIENLSKVYKRKVIRDGQKLIEDFWALRNLSISIKQGEVLGVIGKNGAGKSTLLKIISKITSPTTGKITMRGRVGSLLEVGTGFHPEMTGRENIFMNGNILGMSNYEINQKLDEIVQFSGVGAFLETPVKRYSSGMQTRLAFAVAAHLEPEVLIIDEVLAVGDAEFQKKCLGKMEEIGNSGRTILFVSHNMNAIKNLCNRCIWLKDGALIKESNEPHEIVKQYMQETVPSSVSTIWKNNSSCLEYKSHLEFRYFGLIDKSGKMISSNLNGDEEVYVKVEFTLNEVQPDLQIGFVLYDSSLNLILMSYHTDTRESIVHPLSRGKNTLLTRLPTNLLNDGDYSLQLIAGIHNSQPILSRLDSKVTVSFSIVGNPDRSNMWNYKRSTVIAPILEWRTYG